MTSVRLAGVSGLLLLASAGVLGTAASRKPAEPGESSKRTATTPEAGSPRWLRVDYGAVVDRRELTHSGEPVGVLLDRLGGRGMPPEGERADDALAFRLLDPLLEPYAFTLEDALDSVGPPHDPPYVEIGGLWETGEAQPAWVELCRARKYLLESDGEGHLRAILPAAALEALAWDDALPELDPAAVAEGAWKEAWPVLRHALAAERRRLQREGGGKPPELSVEVHAYRHLASRSAFVLGASAWRTVVTDTGPLPGTPPLDLAALSAILAKGLTIEGARLERGGTIRWFTSDPDKPPTILGRAPELSDLAVAYRAVARGGLGEPYMSLDRAAVPYRADVNYGGRLRDTAIGTVSLLSDVRFKTFSVGIDLLGKGDAREAVRRTLPRIRTHVERFASDPAAAGVMSQQTRFWFYPDDIDLTLSEGFDVLAFRRARMTAASERVKDAAVAVSDPAWTRQTIDFINGEHDGLASVFTEVGELDTVARLLAVFTWLDAARARGLPVPDLDALLAVPLPPVPTPREFPELLSYDVLPPAAGAGPVDVFDRTAVGDALSRLDPRPGRALEPLPSLDRAEAMLDKRVPDQAAFAAEIDAQRATADPATLDRMAYRALRLVMHARVLATLPGSGRATVEARRTKEPETRVFSVGIGGIDLGMRQALARAKRSGGRLAVGGGRSHGGSPSEAGPARRPAEETSPGATPPAALETAGLPPTEMPDHGLGPAKDRTVATLPGEHGTVTFARRPGSIVMHGTWTRAGLAAIPWDEVRTSDESPDVRVRRRLGDPEGRAPVFQRVENGRFISYRFEHSGSTMTAASLPASVPPGVLREPGPEPGGAPVDAASLPQGLAVLDVEPSGSAAQSLPTTFRARIRAAGGRDVAAEVPRALLQRIAAGRDADPAPDRPVPGFMPARQILSGGRALMVMEKGSDAAPRWTRALQPESGEEDAARLAGGLGAWWGGDPASAGASAVVGTDGAGSAVRWSKAAPLDGTIAVVAPPEAFPALAAPLAKRVPAGGVAPSSARAVLVVSAESPGLLGRRLRALSQDPAMSGRFLAVVSLGGTIRTDLPWSLLSEGKLSAVGICEAGPAGWARAVDAASAWTASAGSAQAKGKHPEEIPGPFVWFY